MRTRIASWIAAVVAVAGLLGVARYIVQANEAAMAGVTNGQPSGFYGH